MFPLILSDLTAFKYKWKLPLSHCTSRTIYLRSKSLGSSKRFLSYDHSHLIEKLPIMNPKWRTPYLMRESYCLCQVYFKRFKWVSHRHGFWAFFHSWRSNHQKWLKPFILGLYQPEPLIGSHWYGMTEPYCSLKDKLMQKLLFNIVKPCFKHIISAQCRHLKGPLEIKSIRQDIQSALHQDYRYVIRTDIRSYYASIDHQHLKRAVCRSFDDPRVIHSLHRIIETPIDLGGWLETNSCGIIRRSSFSSFFAALYLLPLDQIFEQRDDLFYCRYNDDILILCRSKSAFVKAKRRLKHCVAKLKLKLAYNKTQMGLIQEGFHFLGLKFEVTRISQTNPKRKLPPKKVLVSLHPRSIRRAIDKARLKQNAGESPANVQNYCHQWNKWWSGTLGRDVGIPIEKWLD